jgi:hypothetical protein
MNDQDIFAASGFIEEAELEELATAPDVAGGTIGWPVVATIGITMGAVGAISAAAQGGCPTTACTTQC